MNRRQFLQVAALGAAASLTSTACAADAVDDASTLVHPALLGMLGADRVRELGVRYRRMVPAEGGEAALRAAIADRGGPGVRLPWTPRLSVAERVRDDFTEGHTVLVDGWLLSVTEARQCALFSLATA